MFSSFIFENQQQKLKGNGIFYDFEYCQTQQFTDHKLSSSIFPLSRNSNISTYVHCMMLKTMHAIFFWKLMTPTIKVSTDPLTTHPSPTQTHETHPEPIQPDHFSTRPRTLYKPFYSWKLTTATIHWRPNDHSPTHRLLTVWNQRTWDSLTFWVSHCCTTSGCF